jgi:hypothetical protein
LSASAVVVLLPPHDVKSVAATVIKIRCFFIMLALIN